jgi:hypothetical protein
MIVISRAFPLQYINSGSKKHFQEDEYGSVSKETVRPIVPCTTVALVPSTLAILSSFTSFPATGVVFARGKFRSG